MIDSCIDRASREISIPRLFSSRLFWIILSLKLFITLFAFFIYSTYTPFVDAALYLCTNSSCPPNGVVPFRTDFVIILFKLLKQTLHSDLAVHIFVSSVLAYFLWDVFKNNYYYLNKLLLWGALCLPHFLIWSGMVGKEALAIAGFLWVIRACVDITVKNPLKLFPLAMGLFLSVMIRPHYAIAYAYLFLLSLVFSKAKFDVFKSTKHNVVCLLVCVFIGSLVFSALCERYSTYLLNLMHAIKFKFFLYQGGRANRLDIVWENFSDVIANLWWGIPMSIVGPTWHETLARPFILPAFLEGVFALGLFVFIFFKMIKCAMDNPNYNAIIILGFVPAILFGLLINYPFGLFNPGSAIRYKQSLAPLFYFYPILLMSEIKMKSLLRHH